MVIKNKIILVAGGGTGGHLFPAISIGEKLEENGLKVYYIGSKYGIEKDFYIKNKFKYFLLNIRGIQRGKNISTLLKNISFPINFIISYIQTIILIIKYKPKAIIGTGGYCSGVPLIAGINFKIPTFIQDQNSVPGLITKTLHKKINKIFIGFESLKKINTKKCIYTGNPIRKELILKNKAQSKIKLNFDRNKKLIFIVGGSQGARPINMHIYNNISFYIKNDYQIIWQSGVNDYEFLSTKIKNDSIVIKKFIKDISIPYSAADIVISRAGALAISELTFMGKAMILIPFPQAAENHQFVNAENIKSKNACKVIQQKNLINNKLELCITQLFKSENAIKTLEQQSKLLAKPKAAEFIVNEIMKYIK